MRYGTLLAIVVAASMFLPRAALAADAPAPQDLDSYIPAQMQEAGIAGIGAAILVDGKIAWTKGYGYADQARGVLFTPDTVMNIASISKTVTGVALMRAVQEGKLSLDANINTYLPFKVVNPHHPDAKITLRQLATHTSGIVDRWEIYQQVYHYDGGDPGSMAKFLEAYLLPGGANYSPDNFLETGAGASREYSNIAASLAGYIVERTTGQTLAEYTRAQVFDPLGMHHSWWSLAEVPAGSHTTLYVSQNGMTIPIPTYSLTTYPDGGMRTSVADLSRLFAALLNDGAYEGVRILDAPLAREMQRFQYTAASKPDNVDLAEKNSGLFWQSKFNVSRVGHGGSDPGVSTEMLATLSRDVGVVLFSNTSLSGEEAGAYVKILKALFEKGEALKAGDKKL